MDAQITRKAHIVNGLKAKMLIGVNIIKPESIDVSIARNTARINSCGINIFIFSKPYFRNQVNHTVYLKSFIVILPMF